MSVLVELIVTAEPSEEIPIDPLSLTSRRSTLLVVVEVALELFELLLPPP